ncbi:apolipoprotein N-acyltransferase [Amorphus sp. 3PC139-8]
MPPFDMPLVLVVTLPALVLLLDGANDRDDRPALRRRVRAAAAVGWWFGFGYFLAGLWWIGSAFLVEADVFGWMLPFAVAGLPAGLALFYAGATALAALFWRAGPARIVALAVGFGAAEWLRGHVLTGFPWNALGYALTANPATMQTAALVGVYGLTLLAVAIFAAPAALIRNGGFAGRGGVAYALVAVALLVGLTAFGLERLQNESRVAEPPVALRIVQPSIDQAQKWNPDFRDQVFDRYLSLSRTPPANGRPLPDGLVTIWPESAIPFFLTDAPAAVDAIADLLPPEGRLFTGAVRYQRAAPGSSDADFFNSIFEIDPAGALRLVYDKVHLVPFGEYLPFQDALEAMGLTQLTQLPGGFSAGNSVAPIKLDRLPAFSALICYEVIFPGNIVELDARPGWLLNLTNDAWFGNTPGPYQHLRQAQVRTVEEGLPLVRAANTGISVVVDPYGRIVDRLALGETGVIDAALPATIAPPVYARFGDIPFFATLAIAALFLAFSDRGRRKRD